MNGVAINSRIKLQQKFGMVRNRICRTSVSFGRFVTITYQKRSGRSWIQRRPNALCLAMERRCSLIVYGTLETTNLLSADTLRFMRGQLWTNRKSSKSLISMPKTENDDIEVDGRCDNVVEGNCNVNVTNDHDGSGNNGTLRRSQRSRIQPDRLLHKDSSRMIRSRLMMRRLPKVERDDWERVFIADGRW